MWGGPRCILGQVWSRCALRGYESEEHKQWPEALLVDWRLGDESREGFHQEGCVVRGPRQRCPRDYMGGYFVRALVCYR